jgi:hypothetical protein
MKPAIESESREPLERDIHVLPGACAKGVGVERNSMQIYAWHRAT